MLRHPGGKGVDIMYPRSPSDGGPPNATKLPELSPRHFMPSGVPALAIGPRVVTKSEEIQTGGYVIVEHAGGITSQYMHLFNLDILGSVALLTFQQSVEGYPLVPYFGVRTNAAGAAKLIASVSNPAIKKWKLMSMLYSHGSDYVHLVHLRHVSAGA